jgi:hypothetical protein
MNKPSYRLVVFGLILLFWNCSPSEPKVLKSIELIHLNYAKRILPPSQSIIHQVKAIPLSTHNEQIFIGQIDKVEMDGDHIYLLDKKTTQLLVFDTIGNYINTVGQVGKGPGEFVNISNFFISEKHVVIFSDYTHAFLYYNKEDFTFAFKKEATLFPNQILPTVEGFVYNMNFHPDRHPNNKMNNIYWVDKNHQVLTSHFPFVEQETRSTISGTLVPSAQKDRFIYNPIFNDTLYSISKNDRYAKYHITLPDPLPLHWRDINEYFKRPLHENLQYSILNPEIGESQDALFFTYNNQYYGVWPSIYFINQDAFFAGQELLDHDYLFSVFNKFLGVHKEQFIFSVNPEAIQYKMSNNDNFKEQLNADKRHEVTDVLKQITLRSNPLLIICTFQLDKP